MILRVGWATQGLLVPPHSADGEEVLPDNHPHFVVPEILPRLLVLRVARRPISLPDPIFHAGQAVKLGHRLRFSIDITDRVGFSMFPTKQRFLIFSRGKFVCELTSLQLLKPD